MPVITLCNTKGGVGKSTLCITMADMMQREGYSVTGIDGDPNQHLMWWAQICADNGDPTGVKTISCQSEDAIGDVIEKANAESDVVFVDLEGAASQLVTFAIAASDLVLMPTKTSGMDLKELFKTHAVIRRTEKLLKRPIQYRAIYSQVSGLKGLKSKTNAAREIEASQIVALKTPVLIRPDAYTNIHFNGVTPAHPAGDPKARAEIRSLLTEVMEALQSPQEQAA